MINEFNSLRYLMDMVGLAAPSI